MALMVYTLLRLINDAFLSSLWALPTSLSLPLCGVIHKVWESWAPSKVVVFSWQALLLRIPTKLNLALRGVALAGDQLSCAVCGGGGGKRRPFISLVSFGLVYLG